MPDLNQTKRIIYIIIGVILLGVIGYFVYQYLSPSATVTPPGQQNITGGVSAPPANISPAGQVPASEIKSGQAVTETSGQILTRLTDFPVISPTLNKTGDKILFFKKDGGDLMDSSFDGKTRDKISNITILGMTEADWSPNKDRAAIFYLDGETLKGFLLIGSSSVAVLPQNLKSFSWSPDGKSLAYLLPKGNLLNLITADSLARNPKTIFSTPILDAQMSWTSSNNFSFQTAPSGLAEGFIFLLSRSSGAFTKFRGPLFGLTSVWSPDGSRILEGYTNAAGKNTNLIVQDTLGKVALKVGLNTLPDKCIFVSSKELYCAVPRNISPATIWPDDYLRGEINTSDKIVNVDLDKKAIQVLADIEDFDMSSLVVNKDKNYLFFVNRMDGALWSLKLK